MNRIFCEMFQSAFLGVPSLHLPMGFLNANNVMVHKSPVEGTILSSSGDWEAFGCKKTVCVPSLESKKGSVTREHTVGVLWWRVGGRVAVREGGVLRGASGRARESRLVAGVFELCCRRLPAAGVDCVSPARDHGLGKTYIQMFINHQ